jgi:hypothetical protein
LLIFEGYKGTYFLIEVLKFGTGKGSVVFFFLKYKTFKIILGLTFVRHKKDCIFAPAYAKENLMICIGIQATN